MEWEKINKEALIELREENKITNWIEARDWALKPNNFFRIGQRIISLAEKSKIFQEYTTLNDNFKQRLENKNRYQDEKNIGEKRPILESPSKRSDLADEDEEEEDDDEEEEERAEVESKASSSKKKSGKKKKKKNKNKK
ncbi:hypothetical protein RhiirC2_783028 [Rhizophagus irregularis]|uniref:Uncharacterized protein n=1 Tax=Rhizophagus irregularis TaxID=588596 RepID=A0A2N1ML07_9GLOM|nr:hypothetical protein RhiirC2_182805 [Rhizophagus irregularis]PKK67822.1 hypothetical protein RhiirC2_783028 [Rhizophagus irregularis]